VRRHEVIWASSCHKLHKNVPYNNHKVDPPALGFPRLGQKMKRGGWLAGRLAAKIKTTL